MTEYIKREDVLALSHYDDHDCEIVDVEDVEKLPSADVRPVVRGRWKFKLFCGRLDWQCSNCNWSTRADIPRCFCPNCGADMRGES